jgi:hypothetical protein
MNKLNNRSAILSLGALTILAFGLVVGPIKAEARRSGYVMPCANCGSNFNVGWGGTNMQPDPYYYGGGKNINNFYGGGYVTPSYGPTYGRNEFINYNRGGNINSWSEGGGYVTLSYRNTGYWR